MHETLPTHPFSIHPHPAKLFEFVLWIALIELARARYALTLSTPHVRLGRGDAALQFRGKLSAIMAKQSVAWWCSDACLSICAIAECLSITLALFVSFRRKDADACACDQNVFSCRIGHNLLYDTSMENCFCLVLLRISAMLDKWFCFYSFASYVGSE